MVEGGEERGLGHMAKRLNTPCLSVLTYKMGMIVVCAYLMRLWRFRDLIGLNNFE